MELARIALKRHMYYFFCRNNDAMFCKRCLVESFPGSFSWKNAWATRITLVLFEHPSQDRVKLEPSYKKDRITIIGVHADGIRKKTTPAFDRWLEKHLPKSGVAYLQVEY